MKNKKRSRNFQIKINLTNRWLYTLIAIGILAIVGVGVYAFGTSNPSTFGHSIGEIQPCGEGKILKVSGGIWTCVDMPSGSVETDPTVLASVKDGIGWSEISNRPSGLDDGDDDTHGGLSCVTQTCMVEDGACTATCPSGYFVTGGGQKYIPPSGSSSINYPSGNGWYCTFTRIYYNYYCYAICCKVL